MKSAIISVGTELLFGKVINTNAAYLSQELNTMGIDVLYHYTMGDNPDRLKRILDLAVQDCDLILCTGGLGPTEDDLTKETVCELMGEPLSLDSEALESMKTYFERAGLEFTDNNIKQAYLPESGETFQNSAGTAPGFALSRNGKTVICMPGVPREMKTMFSECVRPYLMKLTDAHIFSRSVKVFGIGESMVETMLLPFIEGQSDPSIATYAREGEVEVRITSKRDTEEEARQAADEMTAGVLETLGSNVYSTDGEEIYETVARKLLQRNISVSCCESATAGLFAAALVKTPGISRVFDRGFITYSPESQREELSVSPEIIDRFSPYSAEAAEAMVKGLYAKTGSRLCVSMTGLAGPEGYKNLSAGMYYISVLFDGELTTHKFMHKGRTRQLNRNFMTLSMFDMVNHIIDGTEFSNVMWSMEK